MWSVTWYMFNIWGLQQSQRNIILNWGSHDQLLLGSNLLNNKEGNHWEYIFLREIYCNWNQWNYASSKFQKVLEVGILSWAFYKPHWPTLVSLFPAIHTMSRDFDPSCNYFTGWAAKNSHPWISLVNLKWYQNILTYYRYKYLTTQPVFQ